MVDIKDIQQYFEDRKITYIDDIRLRSSDNSYVITISDEHVGDRVGKDLTSKRQLANIKNAIKTKFNENIDYVFTKTPIHNKLEDGLVGIINQKVPNVVEICFLSFSKQDFADVWLELRPSLEATPEIVNEISEVVQEYLKLVEVNACQIHWGLAELNLPTDLAILRTIKILSPVSLEALVTGLKDKNLTWPSEKWLKKKLDALRKRGLIIWQKNKTYTLTQDSLGKVPSGTNRNSSDIERALALGRKKW